jgi:hypothetical protein
MSVKAIENWREGDNVNLNFVDTATGDDLFGTKDEYGNNVGGSQTVNVKDWDDDPNGWIVKMIDAANPPAIPDRVDSSVADVTMTEQQITDKRLAMAVG